MRRPSTTAGAPRCQSERQSRRGNGSPRRENASQCHAKAVPRRRNGSPRLGNATPRYGNGSPRYGNGSPRCGNGSPRCGNGSPRRGDDSPGPAPHAADGRFGLRSCAPAVASGSRTKRGHHDPSRRLFRRLHRYFQGLPDENVRRSAVVPSLQTLSFASCRSAEESAGKKQHGADEEWIIGTRADFESPTCSSRTSASCARRRLRRTRTRQRRRQYLMQTCLQQPCRGRRDRE